MLELMLQLELIRERLRNWMLPMIGGNDYYVVAGALALILSAGTVASGFISLPATLPIGGFAVAIVVATGTLLISSIILAPIGLILL